LPVVADLATTDDAGSALTEALAGREVAERRGISGIDHSCWSSATDVAADIETAQL
jgi:hypothetical protein